MRDSVSTPENSIRLNSVLDIIQHRLQSYHWNVALEVTPLQRVLGRIRVNSTVRSTAQRFSTVRVFSDFIVVVNMKVTYEG
jgi:hypothetical protein